jgi:secreted Zn-dependent insulinase-like peptidase
MLPTNMVMICVSKTYKTKELEPIYQTKYETLQLHPDNIVTWTKGSGGVAAGKDMQFPSRNQWIPTEFDSLSGLNPIVQSTIVTSKPTKYPDLILQTDDRQMETWYKQDDTFGDPRGTIRMEVHTERKKVDLREQILLELLGQVVEDAVREPLYSSSQSGLDYDISIDSRYVLLIEVGGYSQHLMKFFSSVVNQTLDVIENPKSVSIYETRYQHLLDLYQRSLKDWDNR